jgi:site-specific DNA recombinase
MTRSTEIERGPNGRERWPARRLDGLSEHANASSAPRRVRCAIYTRKSSEEGLEQAFNSLDAQREAGEAFILSQQQAGWFALPDRYDDGGFTGSHARSDAPPRTCA